MTKPLAAPVSQPHKWAGRQLGGHPANAESYEWVRYCEVCGMEDDCEDEPISSCPGAEVAALVSQAEPCDCAHQLDCDEHPKVCVKCFHQIEAFVQMCPEGGVCEVAAPLPKVSVNDYLNLQAKLTSSSAAPMNDGWDQLYEYSRTHDKVEIHGATLFNLITELRGKVSPLPEPTDFILERLEQMERDPYPQPKTRHTFRYEDMSPQGKLNIHRQEDGDVIIECMNDDFQSVAVEFCTPMTGGGSSEHTHRALVALMVAMEKDDAERKQVRDARR